MLTLHHLNNSRSQRILWLLEELEVPYEIKYYERDAKTSLAPPELLEIHPLGKSPMIDENGRLVTESAAVVEYICARYGPHMIPDTDSDAYISHMELMHFAEGSAMIPILLALYTSKLGEAAAPLQPRIRSELENHFAYMDQCLRPSGHFVLDDLSAVDIMMSFPAEIAIAQGFGEKHPRLAEYVETIHARPAYKAALEKSGPYKYA